MLGLCVNLETLLKQNDTIVVVPALSWERSALKGCVCWVPQLHLIGNARVSSSQYIRVDIQKSNMDMSDLGHIIQCELCQETQVCVDSGGVGRYLVLNDSQPGK